MTKLKVGDRVRHVDDGDGSFGEGEVVRIGRNKIHVDWFNDSLDWKLPGEDLELVEDQPNRSYYKQGAVGLASHFVADLELVEGFACETTMDDLNRESSHVEVSAVSHPSHYTSDPSGVECIQITRYRNFNIGNAIKYLWRAGLKDDAKHVEDLRKAVWYLNDEIERLEGEK